MPLALAQLQDLRDRISDRLRPWSRSAQFWVRAADIYTSYKVTHLLVYMPLKFVFLLRIALVGPGVPAAGWVCEG
jgi:hypothetical protein